jgi:hypothetical protein
MLIMKLEPECWRVWCMASVVGELLLLVMGHSCLLGDHDPLSIPKHSTRQYYPDQR